MVQKRAAAEHAPANERSSAKAKKLNEIVLYANGHPVFSTHDVNDIPTHKVIATIAAQKTGLPNPKFHVVERDVQDNNADFSTDEILEGDEENPPSGLKGRT